MTNTGSTAPAVVQGRQGFRFTIGRKLAALAGLGVALAVVLSAVAYSGVSSLGSSDQQAAALDEATSQVLLMGRAVQAAATNEMALASVPLQLPAEVEAVTLVRAGLHAESVAAATAAGNEAASVHLEVVIAALLGLAVQAAVSVLIARSITKPIAGFKPFASGDMTAEIEATSDDELGQLATALDGQRRSLREFIAKTASRLPGSSF